MTRSVPGDLRGRFLWLARAYSAHLFDYAEDLLGDRGASAEAVEGALTEAIQYFDRAGLDEAGADGSLRPWLYAVVRRECQLTLAERDEGMAPDREGVEDQEAAADPERYVTGSSRTQEAVAEVLTAEYLVSELEAEERRRHREAVTQVLGGLSDAEVEVLSLAIRHEFDEDDLAIVLGISSRRARGRLSAATAKFAQLAATILLLHAGWSGCKKLDRLVGGAYPSSPDDEMCRRVAKHSKSCAICGQIVASRGFGPDLLTILPITELPPAVRRWLGSVAPSRDADPPEDPRSEGPPDAGLPSEDSAGGDSAGGDSAGGDSAGGDSAGGDPPGESLHDESLPGLPEAGLPGGDPQVSADVPYADLPGSPYADESGSPYAESSYGHPLRPPYIDSPYAGSPYAGSTGSPDARQDESPDGGSPYAGPGISPFFSRQVPPVSPLPGRETAALAAGSESESPADAMGSSAPALADADSMPRRETWLTRPRAGVLSALAIVIIAVGAVLASKLAAAPPPEHHKSASVTSTRGPTPAPSGTAPSSSAQPTARTKPSKSGSAPPLPGANFPVSPPPFKPTSEPSVLRPTPNPSSKKPTPKPSPKPSSSKPTSASPSPTPTLTPTPTPSLSLPI